MKSNWTEREQAILNSIQEGIPLVRRPFQALSRELDIDEGDLISDLARLKEEKIIRQISPIYDTKMVGYTSSLVAFQLPPDKIAAAAARINTHPGVSHNYRREHMFNLWFTLAVPPTSRLGLDETIHYLAREVEAEKVAILPSIKVFKIRVRLDVGKKSKDRREGHKRHEKKYLPLTSIERKVVAKSQGDLPLVEEPFARYARDLEMDQDAFLTYLQDFLERGVMRRFAGLLYHRRAGFRANGMSVWEVAEERLDEVGSHLAGYRCISHCYQRAVTEHWPYNVFAMIHKTSRSEVEDLVATLEEELDITAGPVLYSVEEYKKCRLQYFTRDYYEWEQTLEEVL